ncbi:MAG: hypothetical protein GY869_22235 [Planctomycetes bacterium]|nr:hypothetical protein [Planctomycetota bacterium]
MFHYFRQRYHSPYTRPTGPQPVNASPFSVFTKNGIKTLLSLALTLITFGVLILIYPLVLAVVVAALFFLIALVCVSFAWKLFRASKRISQAGPQVHIEINRPPEDSQ